MATSPIATAADYADAMLSARRAKNALFLLLLAVIVGQVAIFLVVRHRPSLIETPSLAETGGATPTTSPASSLNVTGLLQWLVAITDFLGIALSIVLAAVLLLLLTIMLVGRLIGVSRVTSAFIWCLVLIVLMFPWQAVLTSPLTIGPAEGPPVPDFKLPGVLYTWAELTHHTHGAAFDATKPATFVTLKWARYAAMPGVALVLLLMVQSKSSRGLKMALGEVEFDVARDGS
jgi:hypothetical protein